MKSTATLDVRKADERGRTAISWLNSYHAFSFGQYYDPRNTHFGPLRVLNDDVIKGGGGFGSHGHDNMEIVTYMLEGELEHKDSMAHTEVIHTGEVQRMTAGTGIIHSEYNHSATVPVHLLQIWFLPDAYNLEPSYEQKRFSLDQRRNVLLPVASKDKSLGGVFINQDATMFISHLDAGRELTQPVSDGRGLYLYMISGEVSANGESASTGDAVKASGLDRLTIKANQDTEFVLFDVPLFT
jgi:redox-sensitive bicupin YhaK (pirin superfamily)